MKKRKSILVTMLCCVLVSAVSIGATLAYLTAQTGPLNNVFTIGGFSIPDPDDPKDPDNDIQLTEPEWDKLPDEDGDKIPDPAEDMEPGKSVPKDPTVTNNSDTLDAYVFLEVEVPLNNAQEKEELFSYDVNEGWVQCGTGTGTDTTKVYIYAWAANNTMTTLTKGGNSTAALFNDVTLKNLKKLPEPGESQTIRVTAYAIQTTLVDDNGTELSKAPDAVWGVIQSQNQGN